MSITGTTWVRFNTITAFLGYMKPGQTFSVVHTSGPSLCDMANITVDDYVVVGYPEDRPNEVDIQSYVKDQDGKPQGTGEIRRVHLSSLIPAHNKRLPVGVYLDAELAHRECAAVAREHEDGVKAMDRCCGRGNRFTDFHVDDTES